MFLEPFRNGIPGVTTKEGAWAAIVFSRWGVSK